MMYCNVKKRVLVERPTLKMSVAAIAALVEMTKGPNERPTVKLPAVTPVPEDVDLGW